MDNTTVLEIPEKEPSSGRSQKKRLLLVTIVLAFLTGGALGIIPEDNYWGDVLAAVFWIWLYIHSLFWCEYDAKQHGYKMTIGMRASLLFLWIIAFPYYIFRVHGLSGFKVFALILLFLLLLLIVIALSGAFTMILLDLIELF